MVRVKICGITNLTDAIAALEADADAIGFLFYPQSKRYIEPEKAKEIICNLPPFITSIGVFVNESVERIIEIAKAINLTAVQLHGTESQNVCDKLKKYFPVIKAFSVSDEDDIKKALNYKGVVPLFDTKSPQYGGTGKNFNWNLLLPFKDKFKYFILSGGLTPENVKEAIRLLSPFAVDVSTGVEKSPGIKDKAKIISFIKNVKQGGR